MGKSNNTKQYPQGGGNFIRNPKTGELTRTMGAKKLVQNKSQEDKKNEVS